MWNLTLLCVLMVFSVVFSIIITSLGKRELIYMLLVHLFVYLAFEPPHDKINKVACAPSEDSDQPGHPPSLIRVLLSA